ncbi:uncharacterized protein LOC129226668 [Uloborus diversus]|uniref:uncharacterized protein LOC129226668 n=1 Tax=Uloborus diversus TaxID=327109 RepID=UPI002409614A|nr:uncharacterized protein LOC129226668 [Uloborus diversus]
MTLFREDSKPDLPLLESSVQSQIEKEVSVPNSNAEHLSKPNLKNWRPKIINAAPAVEVPIKKECSIPTDTVLSSSDLKQRQEPSTLKRKPIIQLRKLKEETGVSESSSKSKLKDDSSMSDFIAKPVIKAEGKKRNPVLKAAGKSSAKLQKSPKSSKKPAKRKFASIEGFGEIPIHTYSRAHKKKALINRLVTSDGFVSNETSEENLIGSSSTAMELLDTESSKFKCIECDEIVDLSHFA